MFGDLESSLDKAKSLFTEVRVAWIGEVYSVFADLESILHEVKSGIPEVRVTWIGEVYSVFGELFVY